jgi:hypothetical protein
MYASGCVSPILQAVSDEKQAFTPDLRQRAVLRFGINPADSATVPLEKNFFSNPVMAAPKGALPCMIGGCVSFKARPVRKGAPIHPASWPDLCVLMHDDSFVEAGP